MTVGFRVRDSVTGEISVEVTDRLVRLIGMAKIVSAPGSLRIPGNNTPFFYLTSDGATARIPPVTLGSNRMLSWPALTPGFVNQNSVNFTIAYGEY